MVAQTKQCVEAGSGKGYTDGLNDLIPIDDDMREFEKAISVVDRRKFEEVLERIAPGNPFAGRLLSSSRKAK